MGGVVVALMVMGAVAVGGMRHRRCYGRQQRAMKRKDGELVPARSISWKSFGAVVDGMN
jgi:hypothetical protein